VPVIEAIFFFLVFRACFTSPFALAESGQPLGNSVDVFRLSKGEHCESSTPTERAVAVVTSFFPPG